MAEKTLLITGASTGIGRATAEAAVKAGWKVALAARSADKLAGIVDALGADHALAIPTDVTDPADVEGMVAKAQGFGTLSAVFANAGLGASAPGTEKGEIDNWREMIDVNIWGLCLTVKFAMPVLKQVEGGHILLTGSRAGRVALPGSVYGATKWFVHGYAQNLSAEMSEWGGRCTVIAPGLVDTPFFDEPKPQGLTAEDVARAAVYALEQPAEVNVGEVYLTPVRRS